MRKLLSWGTTADAGGIGGRPERGWGVVVPERVGAGAAGSREVGYWVEPFGFAAALFAGGEYAGIGSGLGAVEWYEGASETFLTVSILVWRISHGGKAGVVEVRLRRACQAPPGPWPVQRLPASRSRPREDVLLTVRRCGGTDRGCFKVLRTQRVGARGEESRVFGDGGGHFDERDAWWDEVQVGKRVVSTSSGVASRR